MSKAIGSKIPDILLSADHGRYSFLSCSELVYLYQNGDDLKVILHKGNRVIPNASLLELYRLNCLSDKGFLKVNDRLIVNTIYLKSIKELKSSTEIELTTGVQICSDNENVIHSISCVKTIIM